MRHASVIGSGPNGLAAAVALAREGLSVDVFEAEAQPGGGARTLELTLPGFKHDFGSAVHPMGAGSPFFSSLPLAAHGLQWVHGSSPLAHPLDDGTAVTLEHSLQDQERQLGEDGPAWRELMEPFAVNWADFAVDVMGPVTRIPRRPFVMARFARKAFQPARALAKRTFRGTRAQALFAGIAAHSFLSLDDPLSSAIALVLGPAAHAVGWPVPRGGSQAISNALIGYLEKLGGTVHTSRRIMSLDEVDPGEGPVLCDLTPRQLLYIAGERLQKTYRRAMQDFRYGPGVFKIDYALSSPFPWTARECFRAITVHLGGTMDEIALSEHAVTSGAIPEKPFVLVAQPSLFDPTRAPEGMHVAWVYCHVPNASTIDMTSRIEAQLERFAPGFQDCVLERRASSPAKLEAMDANLIGGDILGGELSMRQFILRPALGTYYTGTRNLYLCSASTPPGGGVHGMCGYHAARMALRRM
jgi:phytoene dehydrogenase-like protein